MNSKIQDRFALPICAALSLLGTGVASLLPTQRVEGLAFLVGTALLTFAVLRFVGATLAVSLAIGSAAVVSLFDVWLRGEATVVAGATLALSVAASALPWGRWALLIGALAALVVTAIELDALERPQQLLHLESWRRSWQEGALGLPLSLVVASVSAVVLAERLQRLVARRPTATAPSPRKPALQVLEAVPHAVAVYDRFGQLLSANSAWRTMHAATREDPSGVHSGTVELHERGSGTFRRCLLGETLTEERTLLLRPDGTKEWISTSMSPWYEDGPDVVVGGVLVTKTSVSAVAELEQERDALRGDVAPGDAGLRTLDAMPRAGGMNDTTEISGFSTAALQRQAGAEPTDEDFDTLGLETPGETTDQEQHAAAEEPSDLVAAALRVFPDVLFLLDERGRVTEVHAAEGVQGGLASVQLVGTEIGVAFPALYDATRPNRLAELGDRVHCQEFEIAGGAGAAPMRFEARLAALAGGRFAVLNRQLPPSAGSADDGREILAMAAHDLNEPLRALRSYLDLLDEEYDAELDETAREFLRFARQGAQRLSTMIGRLNELSRAGVATQSEPTDLKLALAEALDSLDPLIEEANAHVFAERLPEVRATHADAVLLFQNLISNSLKYRGHSPPEIVIEGRRDGGNVVVKVIDNGIGIPTAERQRVIEPFARLHAADEIEGSGLGLAICRRLVERHGGSIDVGGDPTKGTVVTLTLPAASRKDDDVSLPDPVRDTGHRRS